MKAERWQALDALLQRALELPASDRQAFVAAQDLDDTERAMLLQLLDVDEDHHWLDRPVWRLPQEGAKPGLVEGDRVGPYQLIRELGRGGMGVVFLAEQVDGAFRRKVALKVLRGDVAPPGQTVRFFNEMQILARMEHPSIARLYDGGMTADGRPYFAMEYVEGEDLFTYCDHHRLTIEQRLKLFSQLCDAVHYAHRNMVVHRDIKPANLMVTADGLPKLLDFGIAKMLTESAELNSVTGRWLPVTPAYASPEQVRGEPASVAGDLYSLGVVLFELLTGRLPYRVDDSSWAAVLRTVCETPPEKMSMAVSQAFDGYDPATAAAFRSLGKRGLVQCLRDDLDTVVAMVLRKDPDRRYASVADLGADIRAFCDGYPVRARPETFIYTLGKFVRRHRFSSVLASLSLLALLGSLLMLWNRGVQLEQQRNRARQELSRATAVSSFMEGMFDDLDPYRDLSSDISVRALLSQALARWERDFTENPTLRADTAMTLGRAYMRLGDPWQAERLFETASTIYCETAGEVCEESRVALGEALGSTGESMQAADLLEDVVAARTTRLGPRALATGQARLRLAEVLFEMRFMPEAERHAGLALSALSGVTGRQRLELARVNKLLAGIELYLGRPQRTESLTFDALRIYREELGQDHPAVALCLQNLTGIYLQRREPEIAEDILHHMIATYEAMFGEEHAVLANFYTNLGHVLETQKRFVEAGYYLEYSIALREKLQGPSHPDMIRAYIDLGRVRARLGDPDADFYFECALKLGMDLFGPNHPRVGTVYYFWALHQFREFDLDRAQQYAIRSRDIWRDVFGEAHYWTVSTDQLIGQIESWRPTPRPEKPLSANESN